MRTSLYELMIASEAFAALVAAHASSVPTRALHNPAINQKTPVYNPIRSENNPELAINFHNASPDTIFAYILGLEPDDGSQVFYQSTLGSVYYPQFLSASNVSLAGIDSKANDLVISVPPNSDTPVTFKTYINSGRIYLATQEIQFFMDSSNHIVEPSPVSESDPNYGVKWGIIELTWSGSGLTTDLSYVDQVAMSIGLSVQREDGVELQSPGLPSDAVETICDQLKDIDPAWGSMCVYDESGHALRAIAPQIWLAHNPCSNLRGYYDPYIQKVWDKYSQTNLKVDTQIQGDGPMVTCQVDDSDLLCTQDDGNAFRYQKPTSMDIFRCSGGPFTTQSQNEPHMRTWPRLCAAFVRSTLLLDDGDVTPGLKSSSYYAANITHQYARVIHNNLLPDGTGGAYTFPFDDVDAGGENEAGLFTVEKPLSIEITIR